MEHINSTPDHHILTIKLDPKLFDADQIDATINYAHRRLIETGADRVIVEAR